MTNRENMSQLVTSSLYCSVLHFSCNFRGKVAHWFIFTSKIWMVSSIALDADLPALFCHSKHKGPAIFGIQICISKHKKTLILLQLYVGLQIIKDLASMELLHFCVRTNSCLYNFLFFKNIQTPLQTVFSFFFALTLFDPYGAHTSEENLKYRFHVIDQHFLEVLLLFVHFRVILLLPHLVYDTFLNVPISHVR